jgi:hypothetical protein
MNSNLAALYIPLRMAELSIDKYSLKIRHLILKANEQIILQADQQYFILIEEVNEVRIVSDTGVYDVSETKINELSYEHQGTIVIQNFSPFTNRVQFIQVIKHNN